LSGVALMVKGLQVKLAKQKLGDAREAGRIHKLIQQTMAHASDVAHDLATLDFGNKPLPDALRQLSKHAKNSFKIACRFEADDDIPVLEGNVVGQLYKITQEALTNAIKHGKANRVTIALKTDADKLRLTIRNSGTPFPSVVSRNAGMGLRIMNYRANLIDATVEVKPGSPDGTIVTCLLPIPPKK
ncbi:MAG: hypothetical protein H7Y43_10150, partial [Akkermansiaceae bacterium]|nr:hypothetical protein [Verrucomicrobiales bacterium]